MTATLSIFEGHPVPIEILMQRIVVLGTSGAGKTSGQRSLAEMVWTDHHIRFGVFDSAEDWWGLRSSGDGTKPGIPVVIFGGEHGSGLPLPYSGTEFARLVVTLDQPWIADIKELPKERRQDFVAQAIAEMLRINKGKALVLFVDEADTFAPETSKSKAANRSLEAMEDLFKRGRKQGLYPIAITQRNAAISKDVTDLCQVALLYRAPGAIDQKVALGYLGNTVNAAEAKTILLALESLPDGECYVVSKAPKMTMRERVKVRQPTTFDSSATPGLGQRRREPRVLAEPDLEALKAKMTVAIEEARGNDVSVLKARIRELEAAAKKLPEKTPSAPPVEKKIPVLTAADRELLTNVVKVFRTDKMMKGVWDVMGRLEEFGMEASDIAKRVESALSAESVRTVRPTESSVLPVARVGGSAVRAGVRMETAAPASPAPSVQRHERDAAVKGQPVQSYTAPARTSLAKGETAILTAIAQHNGVTREQLSVLTGYKRSSRDTYLQRLSAAGLTEVGGELIYATDDGVKALGDRFEPLPTGEALQHYWLGRLRGGEQAILQSLIVEYPNTLTRDEISESTNYKRSSRDTFIQRLVSRKLVELVGNRQLRASATLFSTAA